MVALSLGVNVNGITPYRRLRGEPGGLLFGYGMPTEAEIEEGIRLVADATAAIRRDDARRGDVAAHNAHRRRSASGWSPRPAVA